MDKFGWLILLGLGAAFIARNRSLPASLRLEAQTAEGNYFRDALNQLWWQDLSGALTLLG